MKEKLRSVLSLFLTFMKIGGFTFGGGYAMIPLIQHEAVESKKWINENDLLEIIAIAESTPGPIAINSATFVGYRVAGVWGSVAATLGVVLPSFVVIIAVSYILNIFQENKVVQYAFYGIRAGVLALIVKALWNMYKKCPKNAVGYVIMGLAFLLVAIFGVNVLLVIALCAVIGLVSSLVAERRMGK